MTETKRRDPFEVFAKYDYKKTAEYKFHRDALERFRNLSPEEQWQTIVDVGICTQDGELTERYGGSAPNPQEQETAAPSANGNPSASEG